MAAAGGFVKGNKIRKSNFGTCLRNRIYLTASVSRTREVLSLVVLFLTKKINKISGTPGCFVFGKV